MAVARPSRQQVILILVDPGQISNLTSRCRDGGKQIVHYDFLDVVILFRLSPPLEVLSSETPNTTSTAGNCGGSSLVSVISNSGGSPDEEDRQSPTNKERNLSTKTNGYPEREVARNREFVHDLPTPPDQCQILVVGQNGLSDEKQGSNAFLVERIQLCVDQDSDKISANKEKTHLNTGKVVGQVESDSLLDVRSVDLNKADRPLRSGPRIRIHAATVAEGRLADNKELLAFDKNADKSLLETML